MDIKLNRIAYRDTYIVGKLYINNQYYCDTLEDVNRDLNKDGDLLDKGEIKVMHQTAIPFGRYEVIVNISNRFKRFLPLLLNVKHFEGIRIHAGNTIEDTSGCILVGENKIKGQLINSKVYADKLTDLIHSEQKKGLKTYIEIV